MSTVRDRMVAAGQLPAVSWGDWCAELVCLGGDRYGPGGVIEQCGEEAWRGYYDDAYSPDEQAFSQWNSWDKWVRDARAVLA